MSEIDGEINIGDTLVERYDFLAALVVQLHRHASEGLSGIVEPEVALRRILEDTTNPCEARVTVLRGKEVLLKRIKELEDAGS